MLMNILSWALFGLIAGIAARYIAGGREKFDATGIIFTIVLGIAGALVGGFISTQLFRWDIGTFSLAGFGVAIAGALLLLFANHLIQSTRKSH
jgi:uncharacterized membrane protein YeaQ/YmgE (transglycosylase-associated protein family)